MLSRSNFLAPQFYPRSPFGKDWSWHSLPEGAGVLRSGDVMLTIEEVEEGEVVQWGREVAPDMYEELSVGEIITVRGGTEGEDEGGKWNQVSSICFKKFFMRFFVVFSAFTINLIICLKTRQFLHSLVRHFDCKLIAEPYKLFIQVVQLKNYVKGMCMGTYVIKFGINR